MWNCIVCRESAVYMCATCKCMYCVKHRFIHEKRNTNTHSFWNSMQKISTNPLTASSTQKFTGSTPKLIPSNEQLIDIEVQHIKEPINAIKNIYDLMSMNLEEIESALAQEHQIFLQGHIEKIIKVLITSDSKFIITASSDSTIRIWDLEGSRQVAVLKGHTKAITCLIITSDDKFIVSGSMDTTIRIWNLPERTQQFVLYGHTQLVDSVKITNDNKYIISTSKDSTIRIWDFQDKIQVVVLTGYCLINKKTRRKVPIPFSDSRMILTISRDGKYIVYSSGQVTIIWDLTARQQEAVLLEGISALHSVCSIALTTDNKFIFAGYENSSAIRWNRQKAKKVDTLTGHIGSVSHLIVTSDNKYLISASFLIVIWDIDLAEQIFLLPNYFGILKCLELTSDEKCIVSVLANSSIEIWDINEGTSRTVLRGSIRNIETIARTSNYIVSGSSDNIIGVWNIAEENLRCILPGHINIISSIVLTSDNKSIISGSFDRSVRIWNVGAKKEESVLHGNGLINSVAVTSGNKYIVSASYNLRFMVWKFQKGKNKRQKLHCKSLLVIYK